MGSGSLSRFLSHFFIWDPNKEIMMHVIFQIQWILSSDVAL